MLEKFGDAGTQRVLLSGLLSSVVPSLSNFLFFPCADDIPLDRPPPADIALSFTLLAQAVRSSSLEC